jgi:cytochrome c-type biogenesis protein CcmF
MQVRDYTLRLERVDRRDGANFTETAAVLRTTRGGEELGELRPGRRNYPAEQQDSNEVALRSDLRTGEDLFVIVDGFADGGVRLKVLVNPLVNLLWLASLVFAAGSLVAAWPDRREARRIARRYAEEPVASEA